MNILFLTLNRFETLDDRTIYSDLMREFCRNGNHVYVISPTERRYGEETHINRSEQSVVLRLKIGNIQKTNILVKGVSTIRIESEYKRAIEKYFSNVKFDLILYSTPPITLVGAIEYVKKKDNASTYLLLKDIFPQNAVDIGLLSKYGVKGLLYRYFRNKEKRIYRVSDYIGCMSQANVEYILRNNPELDKRKVEICPNSIEVTDKSVDYYMRKRIREKYGIPLNKTVFVYGGNLGRPQGISFVLECLKKCSKIDNAYFLIVGEGTEYGKLEEYANSTNQQNLKLMKRLPKEDYDTMVGACDVGLIFLDYRFTIPNFPSRILSYMQAKLPVLACTDPNTDIGKVIIDGGFGWWCGSNNVIEFSDCVEKACKADTKKMGNVAYNNLIEHYTISDSYTIIMNSILQSKIEERK